MSPMLPARRPLYSAPWACAASSTTTNPWRRAMSMTGSMSAGCPKRCTGMMALVRGVMAASIRVTSRLNEAGSGAGRDDGGGGGDEGEWRRDHFVTGTDATGEQGKMQGAGARIHANGFGGAAIPGELFFKRRNLRPEDELRVLQNTEDGGVQLAFDSPILGLEV